MTLAEHENKYKNEWKSSCTLYVVLFLIIFTVIIGISTYFSYYKPIDPSKKAVNNTDGSGIQTLIY